jgi:hypothetical protein
MSRALAPTLAVSLVLVGAALAPPADAATQNRAARARTARPARKPVVRSIGERAARNDRLITVLERKQRRAETQAEREVAGWSDLKLARFGFRPDQRQKAAKVRTGMIFGRNDKRLLTSATLVRDLIAAERTAGSPETVAALQEQQATLLRSGTMNRKLGTEKQWWRKLKRMAQTRFPRFAQRVWFLRRDNQLEPGTVASNIGAAGAMGPTDHLDPIDSSMWKPRKAERVTSEALFAGPWMKAEERPTLPDESSVLELDNFRSLDADGVHPSVFVQDPRTGTEWKVKFLGDAESPFSSEPVMSRVYYALGYHASPVYHVPSLKLSPSAVIAAYDHKQRVGFRVKENGFLSRVFGVRPGKYGLSPYKMRPQIRNLKLKGIEEHLTGEAAYLTLDAARANPALLSQIEYVTVHGVDLALKGEGGGESIGPFHPDDPGNVDRREMRGLSVISAVWGMGDDVRFNNLRLDADVDDGALELKHILSDAGAHFQTTDPNALAWEVDFDRARPRLHNDNNRFTLRAYDRATLDDARWAARKLGALSESQIIAVAAAGAESWPVARLYAEKLMARRDDLVKKVGLDGELGLLRPNGPDKLMNVSGSHALKVVGANGKPRTVIIPAGKHKVVNGQVVAR